VKVAGPGRSLRTAKRADYNYWVIDSGDGPGPYKIQITDLYGRSATVSGITMSPGRTQKTTAYLVGRGAVKGLPPASPTPTKKKATANPAPSKSSSSPVAPLPESTIATTKAETAVDLAAGAPSCR